MSNPPPVQIGRYEILGEIGRGSMGVVFLARDPNLDRKLALKVMSSASGLDESESAELRERFLLEAQAAARLNHSGIVTVYDADVDPSTGQPFIAMELVKGRTLKEILGYEGRLSIRRTMDLGIQLADAIESAHREGLVHRDLKPGNILVTPDWQAKISDFGIAKFHSHQLTLTGQVLGSPNYMSPEQVKGEALDGRSDLFSLGAVLYRSITGVLPFQGESLATITYKVVNVESRPISERRTTIPEAFEAAIESCLSKSPDDRPENGRALAEELRRIRDLTAAEVESEEALEEAEISWTAPTLQHQEYSSDSTDSAAYRAKADSERLWTGSKHNGPRWVAAGIGAIALLILLSIGIGGESINRSHTDFLEGVSGPPPWVTLQSPKPSEEPSTVSAEILAENPEAMTPLTVVYTNRLKVAELKILVDGETEWSGLVYGWKNLFKRMKGREFQQMVWVYPGQRDIQVHIAGKSMQVNASESIEGSFELNQPRILKVGLNPYRKRLELSWVD